LGLDCCPIISIKFYPICVTAVIIFRTTPTLSTFPFPNKMFFIAGKALRRKGLGHRKKSWSPSLRYSANPEKSRERKRSSPGSTFLPESAGSGLLSCFVLSGTFGTSPCQLIYLPDPFCHIPFFEKAKVRNLEISRPYRRPFPKGGIFWRPILILNSRLKADQKMVTADGTIGSKSKLSRTSFSSF